MYENTKNIYDFFYESRRNLNRKFYEFRGIFRTLFTWHCVAAPRMHYVNNYSRHIIFILVYIVSILMHRPITFDAILTLNYIKRSHPGVYHMFRNYSCLIG